uniref:Uncharacterized protein n=1 Tax=Oryza punctata TaxID=4537 RepID=A0A0E0MM61_ORYPU
MEKSLDRSRQVSVEGKWSKAREIYIHQIRRSHACWPHHVVVVNLKHAATCSPLLPLPTTSVDEDTIYGCVLSLLIFFLLAAPCESPPFAAGELAKQQHGSLPEDS